MGIQPVATRWPWFERSSLLHSQQMVSVLLSHLRRISCCVTRSSLCRSAFPGSSFRKSPVSGNPVVTTPVLGSTETSGTPFATGRSAPLAPLSVNFILFDRALVCADISTRDLQLDRKVDGVARAGELTSLRYTRLSR